MAESSPSTPGLVHLIVTCAFCGALLNDGQEHVTFGAKGCSRIVEAAIERGSSVRVSIGQRVHSKCRREFCDSRRITQDKRKRDDYSAESLRSMRSHTETFDSKTKCLFCAKPDTFNAKHGQGYRLVKYMELGGLAHLQTVINDRNDDWAWGVHSRISNVNDLPAAEATYRKLCHHHFFHGLDIPVCFVQSDNPPAKHGIESKRGRKKDADQEQAFRTIMDRFKQNEVETITINDLIHDMEQEMNGSDKGAYGSTHMKQCIKDEFGDEVTISEVDGKSNVVTFTSTAEKILQDYHKKQQEDKGTEKEIIIETAARLLRCDIKKMAQNKNVYPDIEHLSITDLLNYLPTSVISLLRTILPKNTHDIKIASIGHAIVQSTCPRSVLSPLQLALAVQMHNQFASQFLNDALCHLGFCVSYTEMQNFERCAAVSTGIDLPENQLTDDHCVQYILDNADHNTRTIDGRGTFHGMGMVVAITPEIKTKTAIMRMKVNDSQLRSAGNIEIKYSQTISDNIRKLLFMPLPSITSLDDTSHIDTLWRATKQPCYSGLMQLVLNGSHPGKSSLLFLPMVDMNPSDPACIYSSLCFVCDHAMRYGVTPIVTFDQPLYWKAMTIIENEADSSELHKIVLRIGVFHLQMSYYGSIGHTMESSGMRQILELAYGESVVPHIMSGNAIERTTRAHYIVNAALNTLLEEKATDEKRITDQDIVAVESTCRGIENGTIPLDDEKAITILKKYHDILNKTEQNLSQSRTAALWLQYMTLCATSRKLLKAERTGQWKLHIEAVTETLPVLAATGHNNYTKTLHVYLQKMATLEDDFPEVYAHFEKVHHVLRRSDRFWAGLSTDLVIEQSLMISLKTSGGLSRGRGFTEAQRLTWLMSRPVCLSVNSAMQELESVTYVSSEQHKEASRPSVKRDGEDVELISTFLRERSPFDGTIPLRNIATGLVASDSVNCYNARNVGIDILNKMKGKSVVEYTFRKKDRVVNMNRNTIKVANSDINIEPQLLFQRFASCSINDENIQEVFSHELCAYPASLFEAKDVLREPDKPEFTDGIWNKLPSDARCSPSDLPSGTRCVVDGGWLLHRVPWKKCSTFGEICQSYVALLNNKYSGGIVCFDGYTHNTTKDAVHRRRSGQIRCTDVFVEAHHILDVKKDDFLSNKMNKQRFINLLSSILIRNNVEVFHDEADADGLIVTKAIETAASEPTVVIGGDSDLTIVLLSNHKVDELEHNLYYQPITRQGTKKSPRLWHINKCRTVLGCEMCDNLKFAHAMLGCDTTSSLYGVGKSSILKSMTSFQTASRIFSNPEASVPSIIEAGECTILKLYSAANGVRSLNDLRLRKFMHKLNHGNFIHPKSLPPTSESASYHALRVYHQIQAWNNTPLAPTEYGWSIHGTELTLTMTSATIAPDYLLKLIHCGCKGDCSTFKCSCTKVGLECSIACECAGDCLNASKPSDTNNSDD